MIIGVMIIGKSSQHHPTITPKSSQNHPMIIPKLFFLCDEGWAVSRSPRGRNLNFRAVFFEKHVFSSPTAQFQPREHHAVIRLAMAISVHKSSSKKALCSLSSSKIIVFDDLQKSYGVGSITPRSASLRCFRQTKTSMKAFSSPSS